MTIGISSWKKTANASRALLHIVVIVSVFACGSICRADPTLPRLFSDHMVLQQGRDTHIWGNADPEEHITASLAGHTATATADAHGRWSIHLPAMKAGGPFTITVRGKNTEIVLRDVLIGEVWIASGQSNMAYALNGAEGAANEIPKADFPQIRLFTVPKKIALSPQEDTLPAGWQICTPDTAKAFSAVAYFFARDLHRNLNVPIGVIESAWPGSVIESWIDPDAMHAEPELRSMLEESVRAGSGEDSSGAKPLPLELEFDDFELIPAAGGTEKRVLANFDAGASGLSLGGSFFYDWAGAPTTAFDLVSPGRGGSGFAARVAGQLDGAQSSYLTAHYKLDASPIDLTSYSGIRFWARGTGSFRFRSLQPSVTDWDDYATPLTKVSAEWQPITALFRDLRQDGWGVYLPFTQNELSGFSIEILPAAGYASMPISSLYEGMIAPLLPYPVRGVIWYQGESNALKAHQYRKLLPALIGSWRKGSANENLDFLIVQLSNHGAVPEQPRESAWAELREAQLQTANRVAHTGLAVTIDVGDPKDVHPHRKLEVGQRLALWALGTTYQKPITYSGPLFASMSVDGGKIRIHFTHADGGLVASGGSELQGFAVAGSDRKFHWATARVERDTVVVSSQDVTSPVAVRYAWADSPPCNLFNKAGLPASPFRTDDWPGITEAH